MRSRIRSLAFVSVWLAATASAYAAPSKPNILLIMADDMGFSDIGCYGGEVRTPNLDRLAVGGLRFTQFYNTARCCPTRASLLTGLYPHQTGIGHMTGDQRFEGYRGDLNKKCVTIAEVLKTAGYTTLMSGKWHVTKHIGPDGPKHNWPLQRGFDRFFGTIIGAGSFFDPHTLNDGNERIAAPKSGFYYTDAISDRMVGFLKDHAESKSESPFFAYVAYTAPHWPMHALPEDIAKYKGKYDAGYAAIRAARHARMVKAGIIDKDHAVSDPEHKPWGKVEHREWETRRMEVYAAMIDRMDQGVGRILKTLEATEKLDDTLIFFLADNGGCAEYVPQKGWIMGLVPKSRTTGDGKPIRVGDDPAVMPGPADTYQGYGLGWANVSNTPFRLYKHFVHEGGISSPLIVHWPRHFAKHADRAGKLERTPGHLIDIMATCVDVSGAKYPETLGAHRIRPLEGKSLVPLFSGGTIERRAIYWEHEGNRAVRSGDWKLVARGRRGKWELYDLAKDRAETENLAAGQPELVAKLAKMWQDYAVRTFVVQGKRIEK